MQDTMHRGTRPGPVKADGVTQALHMIEAIREALGVESDWVQVPIRAVLANLPDHLRGPAWSTAFPDGTIDLPKEDLFRQLAAGAVSYPLRDLLPDLPPQWVADVPEAMIALDLPTIVQTLPTDWMGGSAKMAEDMEEAMRMRDYFAPAAAAADPASAQPSPPASPAPALPRRKKAPIPAIVPGLWNGEETGPDAAVAAVDINRAGIEELVRLPGVGPARAAAIVRDRETHGRFNGIYDLTRVPGIGRRFFTRITGLSLRIKDRRDRHELLNDLLGLPKDARPTLAQLTTQIAATLGLAGVVMTGRDGIALAFAGMTPEEAGRFGALVPQLFRRTGRYLRRMTKASDTQCLALPMASPPLLLLAMNEFFLVASLPADAKLDPLLEKMLPVAKELDWLLRPRAVARPSC